MSERNASSLKGRRQLLVGTLAIAFIWLVVLPQIANLQPVRAMIDRNEAAGIDPSAMYYTDLEHLEYRDGMLRHMRDRDR